MQSRLSISSSQDACTGSTSHCDGGHPAPSRWPRLPWSQNLLSTFSFTLNSHKPVFKDKVTFHFSFLKLEREIHTTDFFFFLKKQTKCMAAEWQRCIFSYCGGECAAFGRDWNAWFLALGQSSIGIGGGKICSCPLLPGCVQSWSLWTLAVSTFY